MLSVPGIQSVIRAGTHEATPLPDGWPHSLYHNCLFIESDYVYVYVMVLLSLNKKEVGLDKYFLFELNFRSNACSFQDTGVDLYSITGSLPYGIILFNYHG